MKTRMIRSMLLSILICMFAITGCTTSKKADGQSKMEKEEADVVSISNIGGKDVMPIGGFFGPYVHSYNEDVRSFPNYISDEIFKMIADSGTNLIMYTMTDYGEHPDAMNTYLDLAEKNNLGVFITDKRISEAYGNREVDKKAVLQQLSNYCNHPAFCGIYLIDEPYTGYYSPREDGNTISKYSNIAKYLHDELDMITYGNLLPIYSVANGAETYERYVAEWCESIHPKMLLWDYYICDNGYASNEGYFFNLSIMKKYAEKYNIPFWTYIQTGGRWSEIDPYIGTDDYHPNEEEFNWNVNTCLAYGTKGLVYYTLIQPESEAFFTEKDGDFHTGGLIGCMGNKNQWYSYAQNISKHIRVIDEVLMNSVNKGVIVHGEQAKQELKNNEYVLESGTFNELQSVTGDAMVGCFNYNGKTALYVVNYSMEYAQNIQVKFDAKCKIQMVQNAEKSYISAKNLTLDMDPGEGVLLVLN